jgi:hypothetical protein
MTGRSDNDPGHPVDEPSDEDRLSELLAGWCDGELTADEAAALDRYIERDPGVLNRMHALAGMARRVGELRAGALSMPEDVDRRIRAAVVVQPSAIEDPADPHAPLLGLASGSSRWATMWRVPVVRVLVVAGVLLLVVATIIVIAGHAGKAPPVLGAAPPPSAGGAPQPSLPNPRPPGAELFSDDFDGTSLDLQKWQTPARRDVIAVNRQSLILRLPAREGPAEVDEKLIPRFTGSFAEISFSATITDASRASHGAVSLDVTQGSGRTYRLLFGPRESALVSPCPKGICPDSTTLALTSSPIGRDIGRPFRVRAFDAGDRVRFAIDDHAVVDGQPDPSGLATFALRVTGSAQDTWAVTVQDLRVYG